MLEALYPICLNLLFIFYILPASLSIFGFSIIRIEDIKREECNKKFSKNKFSYIQTVGLCLIPILNIIIFILLLNTKISDDSVKTIE